MTTAGAGPADADSIVAAALANAAPSTVPTAWVFFGGVAAGKTTLLARLHEAGTIPERAVLHSPDAVLQAIAEYRVAAERDPAAAFALWEEPARALAERILTTALERRCDVILDRGGGTPDLPPLLAAIRGRGYRLIGHHVACPLELALERAREREARTGRHFPPDRIAERLAFIASQLESYRAACDEWHEWDGVSSGRPPRPPHAATL